MSKERLSPRAIATTRKALFVLGAILASVALLADKIGFSIGSGFSRNQAVMLAFGLILMLAGLFGSRFIRSYKVFAVILLNVILLLFALDLLALVAIKAWQPDHLRVHRMKLDAGLREAEATERMAWGIYEPYVMWRANNETVQERVDANGFRITPGSEPGPDSYRVFVFGGSTVWGCGVPDSCTIPAYLFRMLRDQLRVPVEMRNFGQLGYVSTQEVIELVFQLRDGNVPDLVVFLDGANDVAASYQSGKVGVHQNYPAIRARMETRSPPPPGRTVCQLITETNLFVLVELLRHDDSPQQAEGPVESVNYLDYGAERDILALETVRLCLRNYDLVEELSAQWGFDAVFYWQPTVWTGNKVLTSEEADWANRGDEPHALGRDPEWARLLEQCYSCFRQESQTRGNVFLIDEIFDDVTRQIYTDDTGVHLTAEGNRILAGAIFEELPEMRQQY